MNALRLAQTQPSASRAPNSARRCTAPGGRAFVAIGRPYLTVSVPLISVGCTEQMKVYVPPSRGLMT